jgi:hypothetical protein
MVVMDVLGKSYHQFNCITAKPDLYQPMMELVSSLHQVNLVHGDLRDTNLWVNEKSPSEFMLVDFDWSGVIGEVKYPINMYVGPDLRRPEGACGGQLILAQHDIGMVEIMFNTL